MKMTNSYPISICCASYPLYSISSKQEPLIYKYYLVNLVSGACFDANTSYMYSGLCGASKWCNEMVKSLNARELKQFNFALKTSTLGNQLYFFSNNRWFLDKFCNRVGALTRVGILVCKERKKDLW